ncbi:hypothetical protein HY839_00545 [Candidatus Azambacteria bacterium]|nr:hypothetical protein [Candidatus Azambacteria bacterium]
MIKHLELSPEERAVMRVLKDAGLLHDMKKEHFCGNETIPRKENVIYVSCCDGRHYVRSTDVFMKKYDKTHKLSFWPVPWPGGTLVFDDGSKLIKPGHTTDKDLISVIKFALKKGYGAILAENHFPCEAARDNGISPIDVVESLMNAKKRFKEKEGIETTIVSLLKVTDGEEMNIHRIPYNDYFSWKERLGYEAIQQLVAKATK